MPAWRDFEVRELRAWLGNLVLLDVLEGGRDFRYRVYGTNVAARSGFDHTNQCVSTLPQPLNAIVLAEYQEVYRTGAPLLVDDRATNNQKGVHIESLALPLSSSGSHPELILAGVYDGPITVRYPGLCAGPGRR